MPSSLSSRHEAGDILPLRSNPGMSQQGEDFIHPGSSPLDGKQLWQILAAFVLFLNTW
jgi:hypothetical protein